MHYKSWSGLRKQLKEHLAKCLNDKIDYHLTSYHKVHNVYRKASIVYLKKEMILFTWNSVCKQEKDVYDKWLKEDTWDFEDETLVSSWNEFGILSDHDFIKACTIYLTLSIDEILNSNDSIILALGLMDQRVGKRRLHQLKEEFNGPKWVKTILDIRLKEEGIQ